MSPTLAAVGLVLLLAVVYVIECIVWPFAKCPRCHGSGKRGRKDGKVFRLCRRCKTTGRRLRVGRRLWNYVSVVRRAGSR